MLGVNAVPNEFVFAYIRLGAGQDPVTCVAYHHTNNLSPSRQGHLTQGFGIETSGLPKYFHRASRGVCHLERGARPGAVGERHGGGGQAIPYSTSGKNNKQYTLR